LFVSNISKANVLSASETFHNDDANDQSTSHDVPSANEENSFGQPLGLLSDTEAQVRSENVLNKHGEGRLLTLEELRDEMRYTRIPSSETPSPMKPPSVSSSPTKTPKEASKTLQDSVNLLLGKRMSLEDASDEQVPRPKRTRPLARSRVSTYQHQFEESFHSITGAVPGCDFPYL
jgi:hypothetical protein